MKIRLALPSEAEELTKLTFLSKNFWNYPDEWLESWRESLTVTPSYIEENMVIVAEIEGILAGYLSISKEDQDAVLTIGDYSSKEGNCLDNLFVHPDYIRKSIGESLLNHAKEWCKNHGISKLHIYSDPNAKGFYEKMGASYLGEFQSEGSVRPLPILLLEID
jgi:GNAT superfamily N-acetyltransferase